MDANKFYIWFSFLSLPLSKRGDRNLPRLKINEIVISLTYVCNKSLWRVRSMTRKKEMQAGRQVLDDRSNAARIGTDFSNPNPPPSITSHHPFRSILIISRAHHDSRHFTTAFNYYPGEWVRCDGAAAPAKYRSSSLFRAVAAGSRWNRVVEDKLGKKVAINYLVRRRRIYI